MEKITIITGWITLFSLLGMLGTCVCSNKYLFLYLQKNKIKVNHSLIDAIHKKFYLSTIILVIIHISFSLVF